MINNFYSNRNERHSLNITSQEKTGKQSITVLHKCITDFEYKKKYINSNNCIPFKIYQTFS